MSDKKILNSTALLEDLAMDPIEFKGKAESDPDLENPDFLAQFPSMITQALGVKWLDSKIKL